jgi:chemotaxis protein histidine kinase CheA
MKGSAGYLDFGSVGQVMHVAESFLGGVQSGSYPLSQEAVGIFCLTLDVLGERLDAIAVEFVDQGAETQALALVERLETIMAATPEHTARIQDSPQGVAPRISAQQNRLFALSAFTRRAARCSAGRVGPTE